MNEQDATNTNARVTDLTTRAVLPRGMHDGQTYPPFDARHAIRLDGDAVQVSESWHDPDGQEQKRYEVTLPFAQLVHLALNTTEEERAAIDARADWRGVPRGCDAFPDGVEVETLLDGPIGPQAACELDGQGPRTLAPVSLFTPTPEEVASCAVLAEVAGMPEREAVLYLASLVKGSREAYARRRAAQHAEDEEGPLVQARALLQRARIRLVDEPDSTKLHAEIDSFLAGLPVA